MHQLMKKTIVAILTLLALDVATVGAQQKPPPRPLIFVPGIFGTKLFRSDDKRTLVWGTLSAFEYFPELRVDGPESFARIKPCGELDEFVYFGPFGQDTYRSFLQRLVGAGYVPREDSVCF
jgi:hypothetical protein